MGVLISWVASSLSQRSSRLQEFEKVVEGVEEMIAVLDRNYRYLIANHAYLQHRGMKSEDVIGRHVAEIMGPGGF